MPWVFYSGIVILGATGIHVLSRFAKGTLDPVWALVVSMGAAFAVSLCFIPLAGVSASKDLSLSKPFLIYSAVGFCVAIAHLGIYLMFKAGAPLSLATPLVRFAPAAVVILVGLLFFQEALKWYQILGLALAFVSFYLITKP